MALLPAAEQTHDIPTAFGTVRVYRFGGPPGTPVVLLPGRNASTPMFATNLAPLLRHRTVYCIDLLGEPGMSVQRRPIRDAQDQASWFAETLDGLAAGPVHLMGVSFGGWTAVNAAIRCPGRIASAVLLDPALTFAPVPLRTMLAVASLGMPGVPQTCRNRVLSWLSGGADVDASVPEAALIAAASSDFVMRQPIPKVFTDIQLRSLDIPVLAVLAGRSVIHDAAAAAERARRLLPHGQVELWADASHAINGEYPEEIARRGQRFWSVVDAGT
ncbi:alpha/beta hydrolase [Mycolicibacterium sp. S2-37]|uniref:alpha/beta fold hydrolase n=1 Tax=Mycolicibacterium sp. S2-37 TaxID=2810297 RepID=UPI001A945EAB|nr:alpha/beta hydrolase [Mycolicibacterium sp. S2-37]MBO0677898.1 alpha/beta hydrolase [Mycolicibacterium sp. S2-37]